MAANNRTLDDEDGDASDWIEVHNPTSEAIHLGGWSLSDDRTALGKWQFPDVALQGGEYLTVFASDKNRSDPQSPLHTNFKLAAGGEYLALVKPDGLVAHAFAPQYPPQREDISYGLVEYVHAGEPRHVFFTDATPGGANGSGFTGFAEPVTFSRLGGLFSTAFALELTAASPDDEIRYTLNGSAPRPSSAVYSGPLPISRTTMVRAGIFAEGLLTPITSETFVMIDRNVEDFSTNLPLVVVNTFGRALGESSYTPVHAMFFDTSEGGRASWAGGIDFAGRGGLKLRGSSSLGFPKNQFAFETWDESNEGMNHSILGLPAESDWVLYGPYSDKSLMRNYLSYSWSNKIGRYAPRTVFVELFLNDDGGNVAASDYHGVYVFMEKVKRDDDRVDIAKLDPTHNSEPEITGGYLLKKDRLDPGDSGFRTRTGQHLAYVEPKEDEITPQQAAWIGRYLNDFEAALYGPNFTDPVSGYRKYIDVDSFIDHHILVEAMKNIDGFRLSTYMYKDRGGKLHMGPIWDYNLSLGNADYLQGWTSSGWYYPQLVGSDYPWYARLFQDPDFRQAYIDRWHEVRETVFATEAMLADVDAAADLLAEAAGRNFDRWRILGQYVWPNWYVARTWADELGFMKNWLSDRLTWMDTQLPAPPVFNQNGGPVESGFELTIDHSLAGTNWTIYFTLDGSDPRLSGGAVNPTAIEYNGPLTLSADVVVRARAARGRAWSALEESAFDVSTGSEGVPGDYNDNGRAEQADLDLVLLNWGKDASSPIQGWTSSLPDGTVDQQELDTVLLNWGTAAASIPPALPAALVSGPESRAMGIRNSLDGRPQKPCVWRVTGISLVQFKEIPDDGLGRVTYNGVQA
jgi:hypothetical protein